MSRAPQGPHKLVEQLADPGVLVAPVGPEGWIQSLVRVRKHKGAIHQEHMSWVRFVPMVPVP